MSWSVPFCSHFPSHYKVDTFQKGHLVPALWLFGLESDNYTVTDASYCLYFSLSSLKTSLQKGRRKKDWRMLCLEFLIQLLNFFVIFFTEPSDDEKVM